MKVVIIEDEVRIREGIIKLLKKFYKNINEIHEAKCGKEGLEIIRRVEPDLVITDILMKPMDGLEMLDILLKEKKHTFKTIILSAYSEFSYARQAISLGVSEYLVKPIDIGEFRKAMQQIEAELKKERQIKQDNPSKLGSIETILSGLINGQLKLDDELRHYMENYLQIPIDSKFAILCAYIGRHYDDEVHLVANMLQSALVEASFANHYILFLAQESELLFVFDNKTNTKKLERYLQFDLMKKMNAVIVNSTVFGFTVCDGLDKIRESHSNIHEYLPWNISLGSDIVIAYPKVKQVQTAAFVYPIQIEKDSIEAFCMMDYNRLNAKTEKFLTYLSEQVYSPDLIKKSVIRYLLAILLVVKELNFPVYEKLEEGQLLKAVSGAVTRKELETVVFGMLESVMQRGEKTVGILVQKTQRMVEEYYCQGITLEEISEALNITPEHISAQFVRELGVNFSTYIKNYRLHKAKELLIGTDLKLYEIASQAGYNDAKYFSRVFKDSEGIVPAEYRKKYK